MTTLNVKNVKTISMFRPASITRLDLLHGIVSQVTEAHPQSHLEGVFQMAACPVTRRTRTLNTCANNGQQHITSS